MSWRKATAISGIQVRLHDETLERILRKHSELIGIEGLILDAVTAPDVVLAGHGKELLAVRHYEITRLGPKDLVVVYREDKQLIITAFLASNPQKLMRRRNSVWRRPSK